MPVPGSGARPSLCHLNWPLVLLLLPVMWHGEVSLFLVLPIASNNLLFLPCQLSKSKLTSCSFSSFSPHFWHCSPIPSCVLAQAFLFLETSGLAHLGVMVWSHFARTSARIFSSYEQFPEEDNNPFSCSASFSLSGLELGHSLKYSCCL